MQAHAPVSDRHDAFAAVYRAHHDFVWRTLRHLGVDPGRIDDALQDTFMVVYRRLGEFEGRAALRTWLFEIARRVGARYRRSAAREAPRRCELPELPVAPRLEEEVARAEAAEILRQFLEGLDPDKSVIFMMSELEQLRAPEIADALDVNLNTVYARLRAARQQLDRLVHRMQAREARPWIRHAAEVVAAALLIQIPATAKAFTPAPLALTSTTPGLAAMTATSPSLIVAGLAIVTTLTLAVTDLLKVPATAHTDTTIHTTDKPRPNPTPTQPLASLTRSDPTAPTRDPNLAPSRSDSTSAREPDLAPTRSDSPATPREPDPSLTRSDSRAPTRASTPRASTPRIGDPLEQELALIEPARAALLAGDARRALRLLQRHRRQFADSVFAEEVAATRIEALCRLGDETRARLEVAELQRRWPASDLATRAASRCDE